MSDSLLAEKRHKISFFLYLFGLAVIAVGLPLSKFLMSNGEILIAVAWVLDGNYIGKIKTFCKNTTAILIAGIYILLCIGLVYTTNFAYAANDLRIKLPLLIIPFICVSMPKLKEKWLKYLAYLFIAAVAVGIFASLYKWLNANDLPSMSNRNLSVFISHIRFSLMICMATFFAIKFALTSKKNWWWFLVALFFIAYTFLAGMMTGIVVLFCLGLFMCLYFIFSRKEIAQKLIAIGCLVLLIITPYFYIKQNIRSFNKLNKKVKVATATINRKALKAAWNKRSKLNFDGRDRKNQLLSATLIRYLATKGLSEDESGIEKLSQNDILAIENGVADAQMEHYGFLKKRVQQAIYSVQVYEKTGYANGHALVLHYVFQKTGLHIFRDNFLLGVGTGDVNDAFLSYYQKEKSNLKPKYRLRCHNQFITFGITLGIIGFLYFIFALIFPLFKTKHRKNLLFVCFLIMMILSMFSEDTIETQAGVTLFIFFEAYFLWLSPDRNLEE